MATRIYVHTLGGSTLDNLYGMLNRDGSNVDDAKRRSVEGQLEAKLPYDTVVSHAYNGFTASSVLNGDRVGRVLPAQIGPKFAAYCGEKLPGDCRIVHPLDKLSKSIATDLTATHYVVISVDCIENLRNPIRLPMDIPKIQSQYLDILTKVQENSNVRPILMFQYRPDARCKGYAILGMMGRLVASVHMICMTVIAASIIALVAHKIKALSGAMFILIAAVVSLASLQIVPLRVTVDILRGKNAGMVMMGALMEKFYRPMLERAHKDSLPILDLPNSFDPFTKDLYMEGIEPSYGGGSLIATGLSNIIRAHKYDGFSRIYRCDGQANFTHNPWRVS